MQLLNILSAPFQVGLDYILSISYEITDTNHRLVDELHTKYCGHIAMRCVGKAMALPDLVLGCGLPIE